jgi:hypothetical protein
MIDVSTFLIERERLRRFCFRQTTAAIVIRDFTGVLKVAEENPVSRLAEWLQFLLSVDPARFADPDDVCDDFGPSIFAYPTSNAKRDVATILKASNGYEAIIIDYRLGEAVWPLLAPQLASGKTSSIKTWDRELRKRRRICAIVSMDAAVSDIAIQYTGGRLLRRSGGETFDLAGRFWLEAYNEIASQRCVARAAWRQNHFKTEGST